MLPSGPTWICETIQPKNPMKEPICIFYHNPLDCIQALLSNPLLASHISFVPRRVWTSAAKICRVYDEWLSGDSAWNIQVSFPFLLVCMILMGLTGCTTPQCYGFRRRPLFGQNKYINHNRQSHGAPGSYKPRKY